MTASELLDAAISMALAMGPVGAWIIPLVVGLLAFLVAGGVPFVLAQRALSYRSWRASPTRPRGVEGRRRRVTGRLRVLGKHAVPSYADGRSVGLSVLTAWQGSRWWIVAPRSAGLAVETREGLVPIEGSIFLRRTRDAREARAVEPELRERCAGYSLRVVDAEDGELVVAEGRLAPVCCEALRDPGAVLGLSSRGAEREPVMLTVIGIERPRFALPIAALGAFGALWALGIAVHLTGQSLTPVRDPRSWNLWRTQVLVELLGSARPDALAHLSEPTPERGIARAWAIAAARERGVLPPPSPQADDHIARIDPSPAR